MALKQDPQTIRHKPVKKVGVLVVHGIGEQRRFEHLEAETRKIVDAIIRNYGQHVQSLQIL